MNNETKRILLISSSKIYGSGFLDHAEAEIRGLLADIKRVLYVPYALSDHDKLAAMAQERFEKMGYALTSSHKSSNPVQAVNDTDAIFVGGGNTFRLLKALYDRALLGPIRERVAGGMPYMGASAGSNVAGPTIRTTNDMPIVEPLSFDALGLVSFQINPHYIDADPTSTHMGETREERLMQFLEENETPVIGLREAAMLRIEHGKTTLRGSSGARVFRRGASPEEAVPGAQLDLI